MEFQDVYSEHALTNWQVYSLTFSTVRVCNTNIVPVPMNTKVTCLNDYRPAALTSVAMKRFERMVMDSNLHTTPTEHEISIALHTALSHLDKRNTYVRMLFID
jgi:hypothetical protein